MREGTDRKILFLLYYFPPVGTVGSLRNFNIGKELSNEFKRIDLITTRYKPFVMEEEFDLGFLNIHELTHLDYRFLSEKLSSRKDLNDQINAKRAGKTFGFSN